MTENTQTTAERIGALMESMLRVEFGELYPHEDGTMGGDTDPYIDDYNYAFRRTIAAEIDALTAERDEALASESHAAKLHSNVSTELLQKEQQLAEARANLRLAEIRINGFIYAKDKRILELEADVHDAGQRNDDMAASLPTWIDVTVLLPASGTKVLAWDGKNILRAMYAKRFAEEVRPGGEEEATEYSEGLDGYFLVAGWYEHNEFDEVHWTIENPVTHWMPLPAPPEVKS